MKNYIVIVRDPKLVNALQGHLNRYIDGVDFTVLLSDTATKEVEFVEIPTPKEQI